MSTLTRPIIAVVAATILICAAVGSVRWAKGHSAGSQLLASALILVLGIAGPPIVNPPQQGIEEAREDKGKKGADSGDPPTT